MVFIYIKLTDNLIGISFILSLECTTSSTVQVVYYSWNLNLN